MARGAARTRVHIQVCDFHVITCVCQFEISNSFGSDRAVRLREASGNRELGSAARVLFENYSNGGASVSHLITKVVSATLLLPVL